MKKNTKQLKVFAILLMACFIGFATISCGGDEDEPQIEPTPTPEENDPLIIESTPLMGYDWNGYSNDLCMMIIKSLDNNPQISANSTQNWVKTFVEKGGNTPDNDGYYTFYVFANIDKNDSETARDFKIKVNAKVNYNGSTITESESCSCTQYGYITIDDFFALNEKVAKWQLRSEVALLKSSDKLDVKYIKNDYFDTSMFLYRPECEMEKVEVAMGNTITTEARVLGGCDGENLEETFFEDIKGTDYDYLFVFGFSESKESVVGSNTSIFKHHHQKNLISISEKELILQYNNADGIYSFYLTALE